MGKRREDISLNRRQFLQRSVMQSAALAGVGRPEATGSPAASGQVKVWQKQELTFTSSQSFRNPYTDVRIWVDLAGPEFAKRIYGFWDGGSTFRVRLLAIRPGRWQWRSGSDPPDVGLSSQHGSFLATDWTEAEKEDNPLRRGFLRPSENHHALELADGTPFFVLGDTWWAAGTHRFPWYDDARERPIGPTAGFKDYVRFRKAQGFNWISMIASFPNWATDGFPWRIVMNDPDRTVVRDAWREFGTDSAKNMRNEGGCPFSFPGKVPGYENVFPNVDRINPEYFHFIDRKVDYLNQHGFITFIEAARRDVSECWKKFYSWPDSYARYIQYVWSRYQANNAVLGPIHLDTLHNSISVPDYMEAINEVLEQFGPPPFGTLLSDDANPSTLVNWGRNSWVTLQQIGNRRMHEYYWYLTEIFRDRHAQPALNGEPYYAGRVGARVPGGRKLFGAPGGTLLDDLFVRSGMYGSVLSGGLAGHVYGAEGIWGADTEPVAPAKMWNAFKWKSAGQMKHLRTFVFSMGRRYQELVPDDFVVPNENYAVNGYEGWAYAVRTRDQKLFLAYFEKGCPRSKVRGALVKSVYRAKWFDPRNGSWLEMGSGTLQSDMSGEIKLPDFPLEMDWGLSLSCLRA